VPLTRARARAAILAGLDAAPSGQEPSWLLAQLKQQGVLPETFPEDAFEDLLRELRDEGLLTGDGTRVWRAADAVRSSEG
jgi:hypothetical protein